MGGNGHAHSADMSGVLAMRPDWYDQARCVGSNPELFFPHGENNGRSKEFLNEDAMQQDTADKLCWGKDGTGECRARANCLAYALSNNENSGVWGGYTEVQLTEMLKSTRRKQHA